MVDKTIFRDPHMAARLNEIRCPTLILQGAVDAVLPPESVKFLASQVEDSQLVFLEDAGHLIDTDQPESWLKIIHEFIAQGCDFRAA